MKQLSTGHHSALHDVFAFSLAFIGVVAIATAPAIAATQAKPKIRVGLYETGDEKIVVSADNVLKIKLADGTRLRNVKAGTKVTVRYNSATGLYIVKKSGWRYTTDQYVQLVPKFSNTIQTIHNYENRPAWDTTLNDNYFYGTLELQHATDSTSGTYVVNELGIENYVAGVAEASNDNNAGYLKALYTAARTYAYYHYQNPTKHADKPYLLDTSANDQVYRGAGFSARSPNVVTAVQETRGTIVEYEGETAITPYFSSSDGRTRAWSEVWSGDVTYLQSVDDPGCADDVLAGHGVGMSAKGARYFATERGWGWQRILEYYYQGITLESVWK